MGLALRSRSLLLVRLWRDASGDETKLVSNLLHVMKYSNLLHVMKLSNLLHVMKLSNLLHVQNKNSFLTHSSSTLTATQCFGASRPS